MYSAVTLLVLGVTLIAAWVPVQRFNRAPLSRILRAE
jgi:hypothetical protein